MFSTVIVMSLHALTLALNGRIFYGQVVDSATSSIKMEPAFLPRITVALLDYPRPVNIGVITSSYFTMNNLAFQALTFCL